MNTTQSRYSQIGKIAGVGIVIVIGFLVVSQAHAVAMPVPAMTWVYPNATATLEIGQTYTLQWTGVNPVGGNYLVNVGLERIGATVPFSPGSYGMIGMGYNLPLSGSWNWKAGYTGSSGDLRMADGEYRLVVILYSLTQGKEIARDYSDGIITMVSQPTTSDALGTLPEPLVPSVKVLAPNGDERMLMGSTTTVAWQIVNPIAGNYTVNLGIEPVGTSAPFVPGSYGILNGGIRFPLSGTYEWPVGMTGSDGTLPVPPGEYRFVVVLHSLKQGKELARDYSDASFTINAVATASSVKENVNQNNSSIVESNTPASKRDQVSVEYSAPVTPAITVEQQTLRMIEERVRMLQSQIAALRAAQSGTQIPAVSSPSDTSVVSGVSTFTRNLRFGMENDQDVTALQNSLTRDGVYGGPITGNFLNLTRAAVKEFQKKHGIEQTGFVGPLTRAQLNLLRGL